MDEESVGKTSRGDDDALPPVLIYETDEWYVALFTEADDDGEPVLWQALGETADEAFDDLVESLNHLPEQVQAVRNDEADLVDVRMLERTSGDAEDGDNE